MKCFADAGMDYCTILKDKDCYGCHFFKTLNEYTESRERAFNRLKSLDELSRLSIAQKYNVGGLK